MISTRFGPNRMSVLADHPLDGHFRCAHQGKFGLYELAYGADVEVTPAGPLDFYNIHVPLAGGGAVTVNGEALSSPLSIIGPGQRISMRWNQDSVNRVLIIPRPMVDQALGLRLGDQPGRALRFAPVLDERSEPVRAWLGLVKHFAEFADSALAVRSPLAVLHFEQLLVNGLLDAQPHTLVDAVAGRGPGALPAAVRRAADFCGDHAHEPISVADMAQAAGVSVWSLREGFRTHLAVSPLAYLRSARLVRARRDLLAVAYGHTAETVTEVALRWGFTHLGRFTGHYRAAYGEAPSQTVRNARARQ
ncbi:AraC family transcriptional regulator [Streptomyces sp. NPDC003038]|uniref:AraC family transcriptional regulator n=1 Tax=unclassified Streptomyces TaxID=2593676 RepID=UPI0033B7E76B